MLTASSQNQLEHDGVAIVENVVSREVVCEIIEALDHIQESGNARRRGRAIYARRNLLDVPPVAALSKSEAVLSLVRPIVGDDAHPVRSILFDKTADANWLVPWHQDLSIAVERRIDVPGFGPWSEKAGVVHVQPPLSILSSMLTVRLHLDDCDETCGPLRVIRGTHRKALSPDAMRGAIDPSHELVCTVRAGGAVLMRPLIVHASSHARVPSHRRVIHIEYAPAALPGGMRWHS